MKPAKLTQKPLQSIFYSALLCACLIGLQSNSLMGQEEVPANPEPADDIFIELPSVEESESEDQTDGDSIATTDPLTSETVEQPTQLIDITTAPTANEGQVIEAPSPVPELLDIPSLVPQLSSEEEVIMQLPQGGAPEPVFSDEETISVNYLDDEISTILRNVALLYDLNLVIPDSLSGRSSLKLNNVTWRQVFEVVLESTGFTFLEENNIIKVRSIEDLAGEPVDTRVFIIDYANAAEIQGSIAPLVNTATGGRIQVDNRSNALIITERPSRMTQIQAIIDRLDRETVQVKIESKFVEVTDRDAKNIGINWSSLNGFAIGTDPITRTITRGVDEVVSFTNPGPAENWNVPDREFADSVYGEFDSNGQTRFPPLTPDGYLYTGNPTLDDNGTPDNAADDFLDFTDTTIAEYTLPTSSLTNTRNFSRQDSVVLTTDSFNVVLSALETLTDVKLVSNPTIVTLNNEKALISIGERYPIPNYTYNAERGTYEVSSFIFQDIGIKLEVTPQVNSAGFINMNILPEVSTRQGTVSFGGASGAEIPIIASRRTETKVTLKDGYTLALGGLMENDTTVDGSKVPILGDIPVLGRLFRSESESSETRNLIIFITAKTLSPDGSTYKDVIDPRMLNAMAIRDSDVPGYTLSDAERQTLSAIQSARDEISLEKSIAARRAELEKLEAAQKYIEEQKDGTAEELDEDWWRKD